MDVSTFNAHRRTLSAPAGEIAYTELGSGPAALFVHGLGTSGLLWRHVIENLQRHQPLHRDRPASARRHPGPGRHVGRRAGPGSRGPVRRPRAHAGGPGGQRHRRRRRADLRRPPPGPDPVAHPYQLRVRGQLPAAGVRAYHRARPAGRTGRGTRRDRRGPLELGRRARLQSATSTPSRFPTRYGAATSSRPAGQSSAPGTSSGWSPRLTRPTWTPPARGCAPWTRRPWWCGEPGTRRSGSSGRTSCGT